jgi:hypothetical protein
MYGDTELKKDNCVWLVRPLQNWKRTAGKWASKWQSVNLCECWNNFKGKKAGVCQLADIQQWGFKWDRYLLLISTENSDRRITYEMGLCRVCSVTADWPSKGQLKDNYKLIVWKVNAECQLPRQDCQPIGCVSIGCDYYSRFDCTVFREWSIGEERTRGERGKGCIRLLGWEVCKERLARRPATEAVVYPRLSLSLSLFLSLRWKWWVHLSGWGL